MIWCHTCFIHELEDRIPQGIATSVVEETEVIYLQKKYTRPVGEFARVNLQTVQGQAPIKIFLQGRELFKGSVTEMC